VAQGADLTYVIPSAEHFDCEDGKLRLCGIAHAPKDGLRTLLRSLIYGIPYKFAKYNVPGFSREIIQMIEKFPYRAVLVHGSHLGITGLEIKRRLNIPVLLRPHNLEHEIVKEYAQYLPIPLRFLARLQEKLTLGAERKMWSMFDKVLFISDNDTRRAREYSRLIANKHADIVPPMDKDTRTLKRNIRIYDGVYEERIKRKACTGEHFMMTGGMSAPQNRINVRWFIREVWPVAHASRRDMHLHVIGIDKTEFLAGTGVPEDYLRRLDVRVLGQAQSFQAAVSSMPYFVCPTIVGSGYRVKCAEAGITGCCLFVSEKDLDSMTFLQRYKNCLGFGDGHSFLRAHDFVKDNPQRRKEIGAQLKKDLQKHMSWKEHGQQVMRAIKSCPDQWTLKFQ
jgi:hypothetical protein